MTLTKSGDDDSARVAKIIKNHWASRRRKPKLLVYLVYLKQAKKQNVARSAEILKLMNVYE